MPGTTARHISMVPMKLRFITAFASSRLMFSASLGLGLPPLAAMSPPAQLTRMEIGPSAASTFFTIAAISSSLVMSPMTEITLPVPRFDSSSASAVRLGLSPNAAGASSLMSCSATAAPPFSKVSAIMRPRPRPEPVTSATAPWKLNACGRRFLLNSCTPCRAFRGGRDGRAKSLCFFSSDSGCRRAPITGPMH